MDFPDFDDFTSSFNSNSNTSNSSDSNSSNPFYNIDMNTILKIKQVMEKMNSSKNDPRSNLLLSLKPYLKPNRKEKLDEYIKLVNMTSVMEFFKNTGGESVK